MRLLDLLSQGGHTLADILVVHVLGLQLAILPVRDLPVEAKDLLPELLELIIDGRELLVHVGELDLDRLRRVGRLPLNCVCLLSGDPQLPVQLPVRPLEVINLLHISLETSEVPVLLLGRLLELREVCRVRFVLLCGG
jgi:hypothetical protein